MTATGQTAEPPKVSPDGRFWLSGDVWVPFSGEGHPAEVQRSTGSAPAAEQTNWLALVLIFAVLLGLFGVFFGVKHYNEERRHDQCMTMNSKELLRVSKALPETVIEPALVDCDTF